MERQRTAREASKRKSAPVRRIFCGFGFGRGQKKLAKEVQKKYKEVRQIPLSRNLVLIFVSVARFVLIFVCVARFVLKNFSNLNLVSRI
jgi:uncharacterized membrane protein YvbJ